MEDHVRIWSVIEIIFWPNLFEVQNRQELVNNFFLLTEEVFELKVILYDFVPSPFDVVKERALIFTIIATLCFLQIVHAVLWSAEAAFESLTTSEFQSI